MRLSSVSVTQTTQLLHLLLNAALVMAIALVWWGVVVFKLNNVSTQMQRLQRQYYQQARGDALEVSTNWARLRRHRHDLLVRYRLTRHNALIMHYVLLLLVSSLFCLALRALVNTNLLITASMFLFVMGVFGLLLSVVLVLMEFYQVAVSGTISAPVAQVPRQRRRTLPQPSTHQDVAVEVEGSVPRQDVIAS
jgi:hypothetical protein